MAVRKDSHSPLKPTWHLQPDLLKNMWELIGKRKPFNWKINGEKQLKLLIDDNEFTYVKSIKNKAEQNIALRKIIQPYFQTHNLAHKQELAYWIVKHWGVIVTDRKSIYDMVYEIFRFDDENIQNFIKNNGTDRISSWSKFLSFSNPEKYPIYDSWNSMALNVVLIETKQKSQFEMPSSRVVNHNKFQKSLHKFKTINKKGYIWRYEEYLEFFKVSVEKNYIKNALDGEMIVFANAADILNNFSSKHNIGINFDRSDKK